MSKPPWDRTLAIFCDTLPTWGNEPLLAPLRLHGTEALGKLYRYALDVATIERPTLPLWQARQQVVPDRLIGQVIDVSIACGGDAISAATGSRTISGLITGVRQMGISLAAAESTHVASGEHLALTAGGHVSIAAARSLLASAVNGVRVFAQNLGIRLKAASGKVQIEAQHDDIEVIAQRVVNIISRAESINLIAGKEIVFHAAGTKVVINAQGYSVYTDGGHRVHAASYLNDTPVAVPFVVPMTDIGQAKVAEHFKLVEQVSGWVMTNQRYRIELADGQVIEGISNGRGETSVAMSDSVRIASVSLLRACGAVASTHRSILVRDAGTKSDL
ncbi:DUF2345 domain-containing protein [Paraburkholderia sp. Cy-641]|uniref:DUF2345 domain-containing protein n=1 Tax=Paraburkholderia sp. Cy-641 TaxID=2608337 RepID=UPI00141FC638|nr:DUF2345 domain-containing protein [Paraburkholderia sp. Cy-641]NIF76872.1 DUF2345 domain-containing protein [Paraburkholderia sp. Cy-641]